MAQEELLIRTTLDSWKSILGRVDQGIASLSEEQLQQRVAPGKNRILYLLGHLTAVHDRLFPLLGVGDRLHPELDRAYIENPDGAFPDPISPSDLKKAWSEVNSTLTAACEKFTSQEWLERHTAVSEEDFAKNPLRNRLAVFLSRTNHVSYHAGQIRLVK